MGLLNWFTKKETIHSTPSQTTPPNMTLELFHILETDPYSFEFEKLAKKYPNPDMSVRNFPTEETLLHTIVRKGFNVEMRSQWAIENGADVNAETTNGLLPAMLSNSLYETLITGINTENANRVFENGETLATHFFQKIDSSKIDSNLEYIQKLESQGINITKPNKKQQTPFGLIFKNCVLPDLEYTYIGKDVEKTKRLVEEMQKRNIRFTDQEMLSILSKSPNCYSFHTGEVFDLLNQAGLLNLQGTNEKKENLWFIYATKKYMYILPTLLKNIPIEQSLVNSLNENGDTPLLAAARIKEVTKEEILSCGCSSHRYINRNEEMKNLIEMGADIHATDKDGNTVLHLLAQNGNITMVHHVLQIQPDLQNVYNKAHQKPVDVADHLVKPFLIQVQDEQTNVATFQKMSDLEKTRYLVILMQLAPKQTHHALHLKHYPIYPTTSKEERQHG